MKRGKEALAVLDELINQSEESKTKFKLLVLRAEVNIKEDEV